MGIHRTGDRSSKRIDAARMQKEMPKLVEQRENLPRLRHGVIDVDEREHRIGEAEAAIIFGAEGVLEHEHADSLDRLAPRLSGVSLSSHANCTSRGMSR